MVAFACGVCGLILFTLASGRGRTPFVWGFHSFQPVCLGTLCLYGAGLSRCPRLPGHACDSSSHVFTLYLLSSNGRTDIPVCFVVWMPMPGRSPLGLLYVSSNPLLNNWARKPFEAQVEGARLSASACSSVSGGTGQFHYPLSARVSWTLGLPITTTTAFQRKTLCS